MVELPPRELPVPLRASLPLWLPALIGGAVAVALGTTGGGSPARLGLAAVGVVALAVSLGALVRPPALVLDAEGLAFRTPLGERWRVPWRDCGGFQAHERFVVWNCEPERARRPRSAAAWRRRADADTGVLAQFGGLAPADLAALLNRYRAAAARS